MAGSGFDRGRRNARHAAVVSGAAAQETWAAVWFLLDDGAARSNGSGAERIRRSEYGDDGEAYGGGDVHGP